MFLWRILTNLSHLLGSFPCYITLSIFPWLHHSDCSAYNNWFDPPHWVVFTDFFNALFHSDKENLIIITSSLSSSSWIIWIFLCNVVSHPLFFFIVKVLYLRQCFSNNSDLLVYYNIFIIYHCCKITIFWIARHFLYTKPCPVVYFYPVIRSIFSNNNSYLSLWSF